ncbi:MAG TPA: efflux transporter outer membrane subunit [Usitatibacter sp.]|jgi:NodT family efflux transporter outer membrane factor (OMF) lipoprotein|nr:efflux transporter outer membrane subunit [Usitatibacter sp.]
MKLRSLRFILSAVVLAAAAGCASTGDSKTESTMRDPASLQAARTLEMNAAKAAWPAGDWWKSFGDAQLDALEDEGIRSNPTLAMAEARVRKAAALAGEAGAALKPQVTGTASLTRDRFSENYIFPPPFGGAWYTQPSAQLDFSYEFDFWGRNRAAVRSALGEARAAEVDTAAARLLLCAAIAEAYLELERSYSQRDVAQATLDQRMKLRDLTAQRVAAGLDSQVELKQAETALPETREQIARLDEAIALARNRIAALVGAGPDRGLSLERPHTRAAQAGLPSTLPADLIGRRPDVAAQRLRIEAAGADIDVAKASFYPNISLSAYAGLQSLGLSQFLSAGSLIAGVGPALSLPVFEGGRLRANLEAKQADYDMAVEQYNGAIVEALHEVADDLASMRSLDVRQREQRLALASAQAAYDLALLRYREGLGNYLQVLSAETAVLAQRSLGADLETRERVLSVNLIRALGGGYEGAKS